MFPLALALVLGQLPSDYTPPEPVANTVMGVTPERWEVIETGVYVLVFAAGVLVAVKL